MINRPNECAPVSGRNLSLLTLGLYLIPIGEGSLRSCAAALGGDQFDGDDPAELHGKISFFNWYEISLFSSPRCGCRTTRVGGLASRSQRSRGARQHGREPCHENPSGT